MIELIISIVVTGIVTLIISHVYHIHSSKKQAKLFNKLPSVIRKIIIEDERDRLSVKELNKLLIEKTIDSESTDSLPFKACPRCGSKNIEKYTDYLVDGEYGDNGEPCYSATPYRAIKCKDCDWSFDETREYEGSNA